MLLLKWGLMTGAAVIPLSNAIQYLSKVDVFQAKCSAILEMVATAGCGLLVYFTWHNKNIDVQTFCKFRNTNKHVSF